eukprot:gnl/MRDRNA2_/MRDRNA2_55961_c0_seq1.p1 gnl/MRDRNA2_/MRDRNA2_55961_c0~~gnl/MRDRNA2_/MRDRNA2_55961_c0_seq1.p1  ORF type:complete len:122 (+),score=36.43 gnl/MRDRNA2_/MRDRNA2_55961_c0_seq1:71-436(+)
MMKVTMVTATAVARAVAQAYKEAAAKGGSMDKATDRVVGRRMSTDEAADILDCKPGATPEEIEERYNSLLKCLGPTEDGSPGSPYLLSKVEAARTVIQEAQAKQAKKDSPKEGEDQASKKE